MTDTTTRPEMSTALNRRLAHGLAAIRILFGLVFLSNALAKVVEVSVYEAGPFRWNLVARANALGILEGAVKDTWIPPLGSLYQSLVIDNWGFFQWFLTVAELGVGVSLLLGVATRLGALVGLGLIGPIWVLLLGEGLFLWEYPVELVPLLVLAIVPSGRAAGFDGRLATRFGDRWPF